MSVVTPKDASTETAQGQQQDSELTKERCLCGKWWAYRSGDTLILRCKLCRRDVVVTGENIKIDYR